MDDFNKKESRKALTAELEEQRNYRELVPRPCAEDYQRLKEDIAHYGFDDASPIKVNEDMVVLDGHTRLQIARELGLQWVHVIVKDLPDHFAEKRYVIKTNLSQRHLTAKQKVDMGEKLLEINQAEARERQRLAGETYKSNLKQFVNDKEIKEDSSNHRLVPTLAQAGEQGKSLEITARDIGIGRETLRKGLKVKEAARTDPEIARAWEDEGTTINQVYRKVQEKEKKAQEKNPKSCEIGDGRQLPPNSGGVDSREDLGEIGKQPQPRQQYAPVKPSIAEPYKKLFAREAVVGREKKGNKSRQDEPIIHTQVEEIMHWLYRVADHMEVPREAMEGAIELDPELLAIWDWFHRDLFTPEIAWDITLYTIRKWQKMQRAAQPEEMPLPDDTKRLGPWSLDFVHHARLQDLLREFPAESAHLIYSDAVVGPEQVGLLGEFAGRVLTQGKYLCVYVDKRHLPEAMARLSAAGLTYFWTCMVLRPENNKEMKVREKWRLLLIYRKGDTPGAGWEWFDDGVESRRPTNRDLVRQLLKGLTIEGQLVVDPFVGSGITGQVARSLGRRFLCFGTDEADVRAANQRISEVRLAENI